MEEVWKDISLTNLQDTPTRKEASKSSSCFRGMILQDLLARPFKETQSNPVINPPDIAVSLFGPSPPHTALSLNSSSEFQYLDAMASHQSHENAISGVSPNTHPNTFRSSSGQKRVSQSEKSPSDRRHKRMIKNRESAARSRARKQAYTNELELEVANLIEENGKLRKMQQQLWGAASSVQHPPKQSLIRTATAPF